MGSAVVEVMAKAVVEGTEGEVIRDLMQIKMMEIIWTKTKIAVVPKEQETITCKMMAAVMDKSTGIEMEEGNIEMTEVGEEDRMAEEADTKEAVAEDRGAGNNEETTVEAVVVVVATRYKQ